MGVHTFACMYMYIFSVSKSLQNLTTFESFFNKFIIIVFRDRKVAHRSQNSVQIIASRMMIHAKLVMKLIDQSISSQFASVQHN